MYPPPRARLWCPLAYLSLVQIREMAGSLAAQRVRRGQPGVEHGHEARHPLWGDRSRRMERKDFTNFCQIFRPVCKRQERPSEEP